MNLTRPKVDVLAVNVNLREAKASNEQLPDAAAGESCRVLIARSEKMALLFQWLRLQQEVLEIEAEICRRRYRPHLRLIDGSVGIQREGDKGICS